MEDNELKIFLEALLNYIHRVSRVPSSSPEHTAAWEEVCKTAEKLFENNEPDVISLSEEKLVPAFVNPIAAVINKPIIIHENDRPSDAPPLVT